MMTPILKSLPKEEADTYSLVLSSIEVSHSLREDRQGWHILVKDTDSEKARDAIKQYIDENQSRQTRNDAPFYGENKRTFTGIWVSLLLVLLHAVIALGNKSEFLIGLYGSSASHILKGELYRSTTSLMLHANTVHLLGNMVGISIFATSVCSIMGLGVGWLMILVTGIAGNLTNALLHKGGHLSVGASTAIFGAIGILSAYQFVRKFRVPEQRAKAFLPFCGGLALLGILGSGRHSDLTGHLFGFIYGIIAGLLYCAFVNRPVYPKYQIALMFLVGCIIAASWLSPF